MAKSLTAGQNTPLPQQMLRCVLPGATSAAVLLGGQGHAAGARWLVAGGSNTVAGVQVCAAGVVDIRVGDLPADVHKVLCIALDAPTQSPLVCLLHAGSEDFAFTIGIADLHPALICFEVYRRDSVWKLRAVGQGYSGGAPELLRAHQIAAPQAQTQIGGENPPAPAVLQPLGDADPLQRIAMIHEDAARITASLLSAKSFAETRLDGEMSAALENPGTRHSPQVQQDIAIAQRRCDELAARAQADYDRDAAHLIAELSDLDSQLPAALAPWEAGSWQRAVTASPGIRVGSVIREDMGPLRVPVCLPAPLPRPVWLDTAGAQAAAPVVGALALRLLAASGTATLEVLDIGGALGTLWGLLGAHMPRPAVTSMSDLLPRLYQLAQDADLAGLRYHAEGVRDAARVVVFTDFGYAIGEDVAELTAVLLNKSAAAGVSVIFTGDADWGSAAPTALQRAIAQECLHIPVGSAALQLDRWTHTPWEFTVDAVGADDQLAQASSAVRQSK